MMSEAYSPNETNSAARSRNFRTRHTSALQTVPSKADTIIKLLSRAKGATPAELSAATGWQPHSIRAFLSGLRKSGRVIVREAHKSGGLGYRIDKALAAKPTETEAAAPVTDTARV